MSSDNHRKIKERLNLARKIETLGIEMTPCSKCQRQNRKCVMDSAQSSRCAECIRTKSSCDGMSDAWEKNVPRQSDWVALENQKRSLEEQEEEAMAKILRLRKQRRFLMDREKEMSRRGLKFLDELDAAEEKERAEAEQAANADHPYPEEIPSDPLFLHDSFWDGLGLDGGIPQASQGNA
jgi:hypothetical protein